MITKGKVRYKYPWDTLDEIGKSFLIPMDVREGYYHARQLVYAKNQTMKRQDRTERYKCTKTDTGMLVSRVA